MPDEIIQPDEYAFFDAAMIAAIHPTVATWVAAAQSGGLEGDLNESDLADACRKVAAAMLRERRFARGEVGRAAQPFGVVSALTT